MIGDVALVGVPGEFFTVLGQEIKRRSPFRYTYVFELANDYIGYIPDQAGFDRGGYQTWTGLHSFLERGTGEADRRRSRGPARAVASGSPARSDSRRSLDDPSGDSPDAARPIGCESTGREPGGQESAE